MTEKLIEVKDLEISFGEGSKKFVAVKNANFFINKGETFSLVGESGSGKTTIGRAIIGLNDTSAGDILYDGKKINGKQSRKDENELIRKIQMIFQDPAASLNERATVDYIISEGLYNYHLFENEEDRVRKVKEIMHEVGLLAEHLTRYPHEFSVGQANYAASKAGLIGFSKSVAREVAGRNVRVNVIAPGFIESDMTEGLPEKIKEMSLAQIPMKRFGNTEEVADCV